MRTHNRKLGPLRFTILAFIMLLLIVFLSGSSIVRAETSITLYKQFQTEMYVYAFAWDPFTGTLILGETNKAGTNVGPFTSNLLVYDPETGRLEVVVSGIEGRILDIEPTHDYIYVGIDTGADYPGILHVYDRSFRLVSEKTYDDVYTVHGIDACGNLIALGFSRSTSYGKVIVYEDMVESVVFKYEREVLDVEFSPDCKFLAVSGDQLLLYDTSSWTLVANITGMGLYSPLWISWLPYKHGDLQLLAAGLRSGASGTLVIVGVDDFGRVSELLRARLVDGWISDVEFVDAGLLYVASIGGLLEVSLDVDEWTIMNVTVINDVIAYIVDYYDEAGLLALATSPSYAREVFIYKIEGPATVFVNVTVYAWPGTVIELNGTRYEILGNSSTIQVRPGLYDLYYRVPVDVGVVEGHQTVNITGNTSLYIEEPGLIRVYGPPGAKVDVSWGEGRRVFNLPDSRVLTLVAEPGNYTIVVRLEVNGSVVTSQPEVVNVGAGSLVEVTPYLPSILYIVGAPGTTLSINGSSYTVPGEGYLIITVAGEGVLEVLYEVPVDLGHPITGSIRVDVKQRSHVDLPRPSTLTISIPEGVDLQIITGGSVHASLRGPGSYSYTASPGEYILVAQLSDASYPGSIYKYTLSLSPGDEREVVVPKPGIIQLMVEAEIQLFLNGTFVNVGYGLVEIPVFPGTYNVHAYGGGLLREYSINRTVNVDEGAMITLVPEARLTIYSKILLTLVFLLLGTTLGYATVKPRVDMEIVDSHIVKGVGGVIQILATNRGYLTYQGAIHIKLGNIESRLPLSLKGRSNILVVVKLRESESGKLNIVYYRVQEQLQGTTPTLPSPTRTIPG